MSISAEMTIEILKVAGNSPEIPDDNISGLNTSKNSKSWNHQGLLDG
jgi:hypothetical protein